MARKELQTLTEQMFYLLLVLNKPHHGYEIMQEIDTVSAGRIQVGAGTMYTLLSRFEKEKYIRCVSDDGRKKVYIITPLGQQLLKDEQKRLQTVLQDSYKLINGEDEL